MELLPKVTYPPLSVALVSDELVKPNSYIFSTGQVSLVTTTVYRRKGPPRPRRRCRSNAAVSGLQALRRSLRSTSRISIGYAINFQVLVTAERSCRRNSVIRFDKSCGYCNLVIL